MTTLEERFWSKIDRRGPDECWDWVRGTTAQGYGSFSVNGKARGAHQVAFALATGQSAQSPVIRHTCDNRRCCNPAHLIPGTHSENTQDMMARGRHAWVVGAERVARGELANKSNLTPALIIEMRLLNKQGWSQRALAQRFGISQASVSDIVLRKTWAHI